MKNNQAPGDDKVLVEIKRKEIYPKSETTLF